MPRAQASGGCAPVEIECLNWKIWRIFCWKMKLCVARHCMRTAPCHCHCYCHRRRGDYFAKYERSRRATPTFSPTQVALNLIRWILYQIIIMTMYCVAFDDAVDEDCSMQSNCNSDWGQTIEFHFCVMNTNVAVNESFERPRCPRGHPKFESMALNEFIILKYFHLRTCSDHILGWNPRAATMDVGQSNALLSPKVTHTAHNMSVVLGIVAKSFDW